MSVGSGTKYMQVHRAYIERDDLVWRLHFGEMRAGYSNDDDDVVTSDYFHSLTNR